MEDALYEIASMRLFAGLSLDKTIPDHTTILKFRHLLERHDLARQIFEEMNQWHFRMKAHIGVDARTGSTHSFTTTTANEHGLNQADQLLYGEEAFILADAENASSYQQSQDQDRVPEGEYPIRIIKCQFGFVKARYRGLKKNDGKLACQY